MGKYVGIDLGTTFSAVAYIDEKGNPRIIENKDGDNTTPSAVLFDGEKILVGKSAKKKSKSKPNAYEAFVKRHMGENSYTFTAPDGKSYRPEDISAIILKKLKQDTEAKLGEEISGAVITVPAYFSDTERTATKTAAEIAGINVLGIINEPTAAAIAFGVDKDITEKKKIMVYDFGGGTFDVSVLDIDNDEIKVISTNGDHHLGGYNVDKAIFDLVAEAAKDEGFDVINDKKASQDLMLAAEEAKKTLSSSDETEISIYIKGEEFSCELDRETFNDIISDIVDTTMSIMQGALTEAKAAYSDIDKILLVGGSTRIPLVKETIESMTRITPSSDVHPDEAVAIGAAYHAVSLAKKASQKSSSSNEFVPNNGGAGAETVDVPDVDMPEFQDVSSHAIGIITYDSNSNPKNSILMPKNVPVPTQIEVGGFCTSVPYQQGIDLQVTQGEFEEVEYVQVIGKAKLSIRPRPKQVPIKFIVSVDENQLIHVRAIDLDENVDLGEITIDRSNNNMSDDEKEKSAENVHKLNIS